MTSAKNLIPSRSECDPALAALIADVMERLLQGEMIDFEQYAAGHPDYTLELERLLPTLEAMAVIGADGPDEGLRSLRAKPLGDFQILREVGRGGMGIVYEAQQLSLGRRVGLKVLPFAAVLNERQLTRFKNEALAAASLEHSHIVPVYAVGCERGIHFYAMRFIEGQTLAEAFAFRSGNSEGLSVPESERGRPSAGGMSGGGSETPYRPVAAETRRIADFSTQIAPASPAWWRRLAELGIQAAEALEYAHQQGVIHRDVKPSNLMLDGNGHLWVTDFGLAQVANNAELTMTGDVLGTLRYMSPEQARGERILDQRSDVYSLGATLYELSVGRPAFPGADRQQLLRQIVDEEPPTPRKLDSRVPADLETIVLKAMAKEPTDRYQSAAQLSDDLRRFLDHVPIRARRPSSWTRFSRWSRRHRRWLGVLCAVISVALALGAVVVAQAHRATSNALAASERDLALALDTVDDMYVALGQQWLEDEPSMMPIQREWLQKAAVIYESIASSRAFDDPLQLRRAKALSHLARIERYLGLLVDSRRHWLEAATLLEARADKAARLLRIRCLWGAAYSAGTPGENSALRDQAVDEAFELVRSFPEDPAVLTCLAGAVEFRAKWQGYDHRRRHQEFDRAIALLQLARTYDLWSADILEVLARTHASAWNHEKAVELYRQLTELQPRVHRHRHNFVAALGNAAGTAAKEGRLSDAISLGEEGIALALALHQDYPEQPLHQTNLDVMISNCADERYYCDRDAMIRVGTILARVRDTGYQSPYLLDALDTHSVALAALESDPQRLREVAGGALAEVLSRFSAAGGWAAPPEVMRDLCATPIARIMQSLYAANLVEEARNCWVTQFKLLRLCSDRTGEQWWTVRYAGMLARSPYSDLRQPSKALELFDLAEQLDPKWSNDEQVHTLADFGRAWAHLYLGQLAEAEKLLQAVAGEPAYGASITGEHLWATCYLHFAAGDEVRGQQAYREAVSKAPDADYPVRWSIETEFVRADDLPTSAQRPVLEHVPVP